jgi:21S rRNA (GM2251-2'-O)-methyltransferase
MANQEKKAVAAPHSLPFTTAASEFLYGHSSVVAALSANRRKLYKLYLHPRAKKESDSTEIVEQLCRQSGVTIVHVDNRWLQAMDKAADGRPHNVRRSQHHDSLLPAAMTSFL